MFNTQVILLEVELWTEIDLHCIRTDKIEVHLSRIAI